MSDLCEICGVPLGTHAASVYTPYLSHADKSICVANIRADERESIAARGTAAALKTMRREVLADLRAKVLELPHSSECESLWMFAGRWLPECRVDACHCPVADVLALLKEKP